MPRLIDKVALTHATSHESAKERGLKVGMDDVLTQPIHLNQLSQLLNLNPHKDNTIFLRPALQK